MSDPARIIDFPQPAGAAPQRAELLAIGADGLLLVRFADGRECGCEWLAAGAGPVRPALSAGDRVLVLPPEGRVPGVVLGRIGRYSPPEPQARLTLEATEVLTLKCGESTLDLRADGKLMIRGQDVLLRAKGTQRIKAGSVAIN
jgi:hypothetical protein